MSEEPSPLLRILEAIEDHSRDIVSVVGDGSAVELDHRLVVNVRYFVVEVGDITGLAVVSGREICEVVIRPNMLEN